MPILRRRVTLSQDMSKTSSAAVESSAFLIAPAMASDGYQGVMRPDAPAP